MSEIFFSTPEIDVLKHLSGKEEAYNKFRRFSKDTNREGRTLASSGEIKLPATKSLVARRTFLLRDAFKSENKVFAISLLVPPEIAWASGYVPLNLEMFSSLLASHSGILGLADKGSLTTPRCSFLNALIGAQKEGIVPNPDMVVSSTAFCEGVSYTFEEFSKAMGISHEHINLPHYMDESSIEAVAENLKEVFTKAYLKNNMSKEDANSNFRRVMYNSYLAHIEYLEMWELRKKYGPLNLGLEPLHWHSQFMPMWGDEKLPGIISRLKNDIMALVEKGGNIHEGLPIAIYGVVPYGRTDIWDRMNDYSVFTSFEGVNFIGEYKVPDLQHYSKLSIDDIFKNVAFNLLNAPVRGGNVNKKTHEFVGEMKSLGSKGLIIFSHEHCQLLVPRIPEAEIVSEDYSIKTVSLGGDCILGMPKGPTALRLDTFLSNLDSSSNNSVEISEKKTSVEFKPQTNAELRLGVDFGNGFSKFLILDKNGDVVEKGLISSGIDYPSILSEIKSYIPKGTDYNLAVSGVGSDNPKFKDLANIQTTEINALIKAAKTIFSDKDNFTVIDIGTQDVKVLRFNDADSSVWVNTNKSCGAGTGMVLVQILDRWQHTMPDITFDKLDELALKASKSELINTTCGIFAVTNVISALVQADENKRNEILRGIYEYIAAQAIRLLPLEYRGGSEIFLTGGVARHKTLRKIFEEKGYILLNLPQKLHSQFLVAYGAALSL